MRERRNEGLKKRVERREVIELLYSDKTWKGTRVYTEIWPNRLVLPDDKKEVSRGHLDKGGKIISNLLELI